MTGAQYGNYYFEDLWSYNIFSRMAPGNKKGLSLDEKRKKMMEIFYESKDVFLLKDLEKIAPKLKGITAMSVKDVVTSLVDDGMVDNFLHLAFKEEE